MAGDVGFVGLLLSLVLVAVALGLSAAQRLGLGGAIAWAATRSLAQLLVIGAGLALLFSPDVPLAWSWVWVTGMVIFAAETVRHRAPEVPAVRWLALAAFGSGAIVTLGVIFGFGVFPLEARALVPLAGMMIGNSMTATVLVARRVVAELRDRRMEVEARLALGYGAMDAARPYVRRAIRTALIPQLERTKAVGIVFLPGAMTGLILAGVDPVDAVLVQAVVLYLILGATATSTAVVGLGTARQLFTQDHRLRRV